MKNKLFYLAIGLLAVIGSVTAQTHQEGQSALEVTTGIVDGFKLPGQDNFGVYGGLAYSKYRSRYTYWKAGLHLNQKFYAYDQKKVPLSQWLGEVNYFSRVLGRVSESWMLNAGIGVAGGYESINQDSRNIEGAVIKNASDWVVGPSVSLEFEYLITGKTILLLQAKEYYLFRSTVTPTRFNLGVGLKFILPSDTQ